MSIGFSTPNTGTPLQIIPCINIYFEPPEDGSHISAVEIGWLGWSLWFGVEQEDA